MFPSSYNLVFSGEGRLINSPNGKIKHKDVEQIMGLINDSTAQHTTSASGRITVLSFKDWEDHAKGSVYYYSPKSMSPWSIMFVTFFIGVLDMPTGRLRYCNAGHEKPFVIGKEINSLPAKPHLPLGVMDDMIYTTQETVLQLGESLFLYTDGLTEAKNENHELFGVKRIEKGLQDCTQKESITPETIIQTMTNRVNGFVDGAEQSDDLTLLAIQYTPQEKPLVFRESLTLNNKVSEISKLNAFVKSATSALNMEKGLASQLKLAVEEAVTNVIDYAYPNGTEGKIDITIEADENHIRFILTDSGAEFDPTGVSKADTTLTVDERPIGGLGVFLVRNLI